ncbi:MAG TPA: LuxR C-terminal-related transcriptional regulator, partial [Solirubrobacteraceae bacterium]
PESRGIHERDLARRLNDLVIDARAILGTELTAPGPGEIQLEVGTTTIAAVALLSMEQLRSLSKPGRRASALAELALRGAELERDLRDYDLRRRKRALTGVSTALSRLRAMTAPDELVDAACAEVVRSCGFSRAMLSRVEDSTWKPWMAHFKHREIRESDREWMASLRIPLRSLTLERELLEDGRPAYVVDARADPRAAPALVASTGTLSYVAAPIVPVGRVIGFLHADHYPETRAVDEVDSHILGEFARGFGRIYERAVLLERLRRDRDHVRETLRSAEAVMDNLARAELELVRHADERSSAETATALALTGETKAMDELLTPREREVIALLVTGQTNSAIAERLVISEGTVKSHVKQILRKLGAVNRSEVIARYLGMVGSG